MLGGRRFARVVTQRDPDCNSPKFFVTQKVNRRPGFPTPLPLPSPSSQPDGLTGWGGKGGGKKGRLCKGKQKRQRDVKRQETGRVRKRWGEGRLSDSSTEKPGRGLDSV